MKRQTPFQLLAILSLLLSAFTIRPPAPRGEDLTLTFRFTTTVKADGSGTVGLEMNLSPDLVRKLENNSTDFSAHATCQRMESGFTEFEFSTKTENEGIQCVGTEAFKDLKELKNFLEDKMGMNVRKLEIKDRRFYYDVQFSWSPLSQSTFKVEQFWVLVLPGTHGDNNADTTAGNTLTWDLSQANGLISLEAESSVGGGLFGIDSTTFAILAFVILSCCCCILLLIVGGIALFLISRRKKSSAADAGTPSP
jgi:hypothetical protein